MHTYQVSTPSNNIATGSNDLKHIPYCTLKSQVHIFASSGSLNTCRLMMHHIQKNKKSLSTWFCPKANKF